MPLQFADVPNFDAANMFDMSRFQGLTCYGNAPLVDAAMWYVHYKTKTKGLVGMLTTSTLPLAIKRACKLLDRGLTVSEIEGSSGLKGMNADEIRLSYVEWKAKRDLR